MREGTKNTLKGETHFVLEWWAAGYFDQKWREVGYRKISPVLSYGDILNLPERLGNGRGISCVNNNYSLTKYIKLNKIMPFWLI